MTMTWRLNETYRTAALRDLRHALDMAKRGDVSPRSCDRIRQAIKSLEGAHRHAVGRVCTESLEL
jgi:hypothetical protein